MFVLISLRGKWFCHFSLGFEVVKDTFRRAIRLYLSDWLRALETISQVLFFCLSVAETQKENGRALEVRAVSHVIQRLEINTLLRCISGFQAHLAEGPVFQSWGLRRSKNEGRRQYHPPASHLDWRRAECQPLSRRPPAMFWSLHRENTELFFQCSRAVSYTHMTLPTNSRV